MFAIHVYINEFKDVVEASGDRRVRRSQQNATMEFVTPQIAQLWIVLENDRYDLVLLEFVATSCKRQQTRGEMPDMYMAIWAV
jgi:hypothetical protein